MTRPAAHFTPGSGWLNDPLSPTWDGERYHLFFQHVPRSTTWAAACHWGHAVSTDLTTWQEGSVALAPGDGDGGVWSGSVVPRPGGGWRAFYTAVDVDAPAVGRVRWADADSLDGPWTKRDTLLHPPAGLGVTSFRDPFVERTETGWRMLLAASLPGEVAAVLSWSTTSPGDLDTWTYDGVALDRAATEADPLWTGSLWECPQLIGVDGVDVLVGSVWHHDVLHHVVAAPVDRAGPALVPRAWQQLTAGEGYYAPVVFRDAGGEPAMMLWIRGYVDAAAGRAGVLSLPHRLASYDGRIVLRPHPAVGHRLTGPLDVSTAPVQVTTDVRLAAVAGGVAVEVAGAATVLDAPPHGIHVAIDGPVVEVLTLGTSLAAVVP